jgi:hypothetical protein
MAAPQPNALWDVQRLLLLAAKKGSPATCPMARIPADELTVLCGMISEYLRVPPDMHLHPPAHLFCRICFTSICDTCVENGVDCQCGSNDLLSRPSVSQGAPRAPPNTSKMCNCTLSWFGWPRWLRGEPGRTLPCHYALQDRCFACGGGACASCGA